LGANADRVDYSYSMSSRTPGTGTGLTVHVVHRNPSNPGGKPPAVTRNVIELPAGGRFDNGAVEQCDATDEELQAEGRDACPARSKVGAGRIVVVTGFGGPVDPYPTDVTLFNAPHSVIELIQQQGTNNTLAVDRAPVSGGTYVAAPPPTPGGPPDGRTVIRSVDFTFAPPPTPVARSFITTPPTCRSSNRWTSRGTFTYADGVVVQKLAGAPCEAAELPPLRVRISGVPRHCVHKQFRAHVRTAGGGALRAVRVRVDNRRLGSRSVRNFSVRVRVRRLGRGRHRLRVTAIDAAGHRVRRTIGFTRCRVPLRGR
jgi:hypothetical protein